MDALSKNVVTDLLKLLSDPVAYAAYCTERAQRRNVTRLDRAQRWRAAISLVTDEQQAQIHALRGLSARATRVFKIGERVAVLMQRDNVFDNDTSKLRCKLYVVYPDGSRVETFDKSIRINEALITKGE